MSLPLSHYPQATNLSFYKGKIQELCGARIRCVLYTVSYPPQLHSQSKGGAVEGGSGHAHGSPPQSGSSPPLCFSVLGLCLKPRKYAQKACNYSLEARGLTFL